MSIELFIILTIKARELWAERNSQTNPPTSQASTFLTTQKINRPAMVVHTFNLSAWEAEAGRSLPGVPGQPGLYSEALPQLQTTENK